MSVDMQHGFKISDVCGHKKAITLVIAFLLIHIKCIVMQNFLFPRVCWKKWSSRR